MIKNERQYRIAKAQAAKFESALKAFSSVSRKDRTTHLSLLKAQKDAMQSQLDSLRQELRDYKELESPAEVETQRSGLSALRDIESDI